MAAKKQSKPSGKRKGMKVSISKLTNKRLNKLVKRGRLKKRIPGKNSYLNLLKQRTEKKEKDLTPQERREKYSHKEKEKDIPLEEADYEYFAQEGRDYSFLTELVNSDHGEQSSCKRRKRNKREEDDSLEVKYENLSKKQPSQETKALLPIKSKEGVIQRSIEVSESEDESAEETHDNGDIEDETSEPLPDLSPAELFLQRQQKLSAKKHQIARFASTIVENPEENVSKIREIRLLLDEDDPEIFITVRKLVALSLLEVFRDIIPDYRIRLATEKEKEQSAKKETKKIREFEEGLLSNYKHYLSFLESVAQGKTVKRQKSAKRNNNFKIPADASESLREVALKCLSELLLAHPHFNFRTNIIAVLIPFMNHKNEQVSETICDYIRRIFRSDKAGQVTLEIVRLIGRMIKVKNFEIYPRVLNTFLSLKIREVDLGDGKEGRTLESKAARREKYRKMSKRDRKRAKQMKELKKELEDAAASENKDQKLKLNTETMKVVFLAYFRILKQGQGSDLLGPALEGLAKFAHLINIDFFDDLFNVLNVLVESEEMDYRESLHCIQTAFTILTGQGDIFNIDPLNFYRHLYKTLFHLHAGETSDDVAIAIDCLDILINKRKRQVSHQRLLSFIKRLASVCLQLPANGTLGILATVRNLTLVDRRSDILYDTESLGSGVYLAELDDPEHANASNTALYELHTLKHHFHPDVRQYADHVLHGAPSTGAKQLKPELSRRSPAELFEVYSQNAMEFQLPEISASKRQSRTAKEFKQEIIREKCEETLVKLNDIRTNEIDFHLGLSICTSHNRKQKEKQSVAVSRKRKKLAKHNKM